MSARVAVVGAGVSGLTTAIVFAEKGFDVSVFADKTGQETTSAAAAAIWFPYDAEPADKVIPWALTTYKMLVDLARNPASGVSMIELRQFSRTTDLKIPNWAHSLGGSVTLHPAFRSGYSVSVPLTDTTIYLVYLRDRLTNEGVKIQRGIRFNHLEDVDNQFDVVINCAGFGAKELVHDPDLEPHRGQVAIMPKITGLNCAIVCDDAPLMYAIPRQDDCVFGGTNEITDDQNIDPAATSRIVNECCRVLDITPPKILSEKVGLRPFRKSGVRLEAGKFTDGRTFIHNYGHGGAGFTLSWGCACDALSFVRA